MDKRILMFSLISALFLFLGCAQQSSIKPEDLAALKAENQSLSNQIDTLNTQISNLQAQISNSNQMPVQSTVEITNTTLISSLQEQLSSNETMLSNLEESLEVTLVTNIFFDEGSDVIKPEGKSALDSVIGMLNSQQGKIIRVEGYTDYIPIASKHQWKFPSNWELSTARADAVVRYLVDKGVKPELIKASGYSKFNPIASNDTAEGRAQNRRIEVELITDDSRAVFK
jgi:chemotaxis protein MotB